MPRSRSHLTAILLAGLLIGGVLAALPVAGEAVITDGGERESETTTTMMDDDTPVEAAVDCNHSRIELTAPEDYRYDVTVAVANLTPATNDVSRSTIGSVEGNETVEFDGEGIVFVFVDGRSDDAEAVATDVTNCSTDLGESTTTVQGDDESTTTMRASDEPAIRIDCEENDVRFVGFEGSEYVAKVVAVSVSSTSSSTSSVTRTLEGNATVSVDEEEALVAAFASTGTLGDDRTVSAIRNCSPYGPERVAANESGSETRNDGFEDR